MSTRTVGFIYSETIAYTIEFGNLYASFFYDGALLDTDGAPIATPYLTADLPQLQFKQLGDVMWIIHPSYAPRKLSRTTATTFSLDKIVFDRGPFKLRNDLLEDDDVTMTYAGDEEAAGTGTLTASSATFTSSHAGALFQLTSSRSAGDSTVSSTGSSASSAISVKGNFSFNTHGTWTGTVELQRKQGSNPWEVFRTFIASNDRNIQYTGTESDYNVTYRISPNNDVTTMSSGFSADITVNSSTIVGIVRVSSFTSSTVVNATVIAYLGESTTVATYRWAEGSWSDELGYPKGITFIADRAVYGVNRDIYLSRVGDYENFDDDVKDADAFSVSITSGNQIVWLDTIDKTLAIATTGKPWSLQSNKIGTPMTPTNFNLDEESGYGSADIQNLKIDNALIYVDLVGKKLMQYTWNSQTQKYLSTELTILAEHFSATASITWLAHREHPESIIWFGMDDGTLNSLTYNIDQNVIAYSTHPTDGNVRSGCVIPGTNEDEIWFSIDRTLNSSAVTVIERMTARRVTDIDDFHFVDSGVTYDSTATTTITGLTHLEGETVAVWADGASVGPKTVASGQITLDAAASKVHVGMPFTPVVKPMRLDTETSGGSTHASIKKASEISISLLDSVDVAYGDSETNVYDVDLTSAQLVNNSDITGLFTGDATEHQNAGFSIEDPIIITSKKTTSVTNPSPLTVRAIVSRVDKVGR